MSTVLNNNIDKLCIDNIRVLCSEMIDKAKSGHPGMAMQHQVKQNGLIEIILFYLVVMQQVYYIQYYIYLDMKFQWMI